MIDDYDRQQMLRSMCNVIMAREATLEGIRRLVVCGCMGKKWECCCECSFGCRDEDRAITYAQVLSGCLFVL